MYIVHNLTNKTVILSDLRVEIGPRRVLDLEQICKRDTIDNSADLRQALLARKLALGRHSIIRSSAAKPVEAPPEVKTVERVVETHKIDEEKLAKLIQKTVAEEISKHKTPEPKPQDDIKSTVNEALKQGVAPLIESIRDQINNIQIPQGQAQQERRDEINIDPEKLAQLSQKNIEKLSESIETSGTTKTKEIKIINKRNASDLANELD